MTDAATVYQGLRPRLNVIVQAADSDHVYGKMLVVAEARHRLSSLQDVQTF